MDIKSISKTELRQVIPISDVYMESESAWFKNRKKKLSITERVLKSLWIALALMFIAWYLVSAPHVVHVVSLITTDTIINGRTLDWAVFVPIGLEFGILLIAIMLSAGWDTVENRRIRVLLIVFSIVINLFGSFIAVSHLTGVGQLEIIAGYVVSVFMGIGVPIMTDWSGNALVHIASGKVEFKITDLEKLWNAQGQDVFRKALYNIALSEGATIRTANAFSDEVSRDYFKGSETEDSETAWTDAGQNRAVPLSQPYNAVPLPTAQMGFVGLPEHRANSSVPNGSDKVDRMGHGQLLQPVPFSQESVLIWAEQNPEHLQQILDRPMGKTAKSKIIARAMGVSDGKYKTIGRALEDRF